jgi:VWFA-related protein
MRWFPRLVLFGALAMAQDNAVFKAGVSLVHVDAEVTDGTRLLSGFHKDDFQVSDNGTPQTILYFSAEETPLDMILLFDKSGSMLPKLKKLAASAKAAFAELRSGDRVAVMTFNTKATIVEPFTSDMHEVETIINDKVLTKARGGTHILRAVSDAAAYFLKQPRTERRRAVLIVTDNHGQPSGRKNMVVHDLWEADALLSGLELRTSGEGVALKAAWVLSPQTAWMQMENMTGVVEKTGGDLLKGHDPGADFEEMIRRLRLRYMIVYAMPAGKPGEERKVKVELTGSALQQNPQAKVRARDGYLIPSGQMSR